MKGLFVSSGNSNNGISPIVRSQGESLERNGIQLKYFTIKGKGVISYINHIFMLRKHLRTNKYDFIHAHYSFSGYVAGVSQTKPVIVSLMGSDVKGNIINRLIIKIFYKFFWDATIVKSLDMKQSLGVKHLHIIPNGVDLELFKPLSQGECQNKLGWNKENKHILFASDPHRYEKNFPLFNRAYNLLKEKHKNVEFHTLINIQQNNIPIYLNASDIICLSSFWEGSPNIIKEAMACGCIIVTTDVGDIKETIHNTDGCFLTSFDSNNFAEKLKMGLDFSAKFNKTTGRSRLIDLGLDSVTIAKKLIKIYNKESNP
ncbi:MAG: glycosyltransferase [Bacteroidetes bacterium]|nr:glycosyltransferase [Bacteroidota bacterium]